MYASTAETLFRFYPLAANPGNTVDLIIKDLRGRIVTNRPQRPAYPILREEALGSLFTELIGFAHDITNPAPKATRIATSASRHLYRGRVEV